MYLFEHSLNGIQLVRQAQVEVPEVRPAEGKCTNQQGNKTSQDAAVLLDAENLPAWCGVSVIANAQSMDPAGNIKRILAFSNWRDYRTTRRGSWPDVINRFKVQAVQVDKCRGKRNAVDIALAVNATLLYQSGKITRFFIMSNDGDYLYLVNFLRDRGCSVYGYGTMANQRFKESFTQFFSLDSEMPGKYAIQP